MARDHRLVSFGSNTLNSAPSFAGLIRGQTSGAGIQPREYNHQEQCDVNETVQNQENSKECMSEMMGVFRKFVRVCQQQLQDHTLEEERVKDRKQNRFMLFLRCDPPKFYGGPDARRAEAWITEVKKIFRVMCCDEEEEVEYAVFLLQGVAYNWWRLVEQSWNANNTPVTWTNFVEEFKDRFVPQAVRFSWGSEVMDLTQGSKSVSEYDAEFTRLVTRLPWLMNDERLMVEFFIRGLRPEIQSSIILGRDIKEYKEAVSVAVNSEAFDKHFETRKRKAQAPLAGKRKGKARAYAFKG